MTEDEFDEAAYLAVHADVQAAVGRGEFTSGFDHWMKFGRAEGRGATPHPAPAQAAPGRAWAPRRPAVRVCPVCAAAGPIPALLEERGHVLHRCPACRACFYADRTMPDYEEETEVPFYQQVYLEQNGSIHHVTRFLFMVDDDGIDSVLDVGCGFGFGVDLAARALGWRAVGIDPSHYAAAGAATLGADIRKGYLTDATELGDRFGLVIASEVIEHVPDPAAFLQVLRRWLRPGAVLILTTPDADAVQPEAGEAEMISILALGTHLFLFAAPALELVLRQAGFAHVSVESRANNLVALASDMPIRRRGDAEERHIQAYQTYLERLTETLEPGTKLWNGAAGRLLQLQVGWAPLERLHALFARVAAAWRAQPGIDLARLRLPEPLPEAEFAGAGKPFMWRVGPRHPINLATVLFCRAQMEARRPGRLPEDVLRWARPAYVHAIETVRVLMAGTIIDLDLRQTAWRARLLIADCLAELAPELEGELLVGLGTPAPGALHGRVDPPPGMLAARMAPWFLRMVGMGRLDEAARVLPWLSDPAALAAVEDAGAVAAAVAALRGRNPDAGAAPPDATVPPPPAAPRRRARRPRAS